LIKTKGNFPVPVHEKWKRDVETEMQIIHEDDDRKEHITKLTITGPPDNIINEPL
jgi:hypothetical protein